MKTFILSVGELWARRYFVEAETETEALNKYKKWLEQGLPLDLSIESDSPEYVSDIQGDIIVLDRETE